MECGAGLVRDLPGVPAWAGGAAGAALRRVDRVYAEATEEFGLGAFAAEDVQQGAVLLEEEPLLQGPLQAPRLARHAADLTARTSVEAGSHLFPAQVASVNVGILDAYEAADASTREEVDQMQSQVDPASAIGPSARSAAELLAELRSYQLDASTMERVLLVARVNAHALGSDRQALFRKGRLIAHGCSPNCVFVVTRCRAEAEDSREIILGSWHALRSIAKGELLTALYIPEDFVASSIAQRRHYLLCQRGFACRCAACLDGSPDVFARLPCPRCRPRLLSGDLADDQLAGCCTVRTACWSPPWRADCGHESEDAEVALPDGAEDLAREVLHQALGAAGGLPSTAAARNAQLAKVLRCFGEDHFVAQLLLRGGALRAVAALQTLGQTAERLARCHDYLVRGGLPLGMMPMYGLYRAIIARAQAEAKAKGAEAIPAAWPGLVDAAARCAAIVEGADSELARRGAVCARLASAAAAARQGDA